jgi:hypothetical protein
MSKFEKIALGVIGTGLLASVVYFIIVEMGRMG